MDPMHSEQAALWETIRENPHDDAPRLIYSDWLEEHDDPARAEFIRRQIADERALAEGRRDESSRQNRARANQLLRSHRHRWWTPLHQFLDRTEFQRGFPSPKFDSRHFRSLIQLTRYYHDVIPEWRLTMESGVNRLLEYATHSCFRMAVALELLSDIPNPAILAPYLNAPNLLNIWSLSLSMERIRTGHLEVLVDSPLPGQLREFAITRPSAINFSHLRTALRGREFTHLHSLELIEQQVTDEVLWKIDEVLPLRRFRRLNLRRNLIGPDGINCLFAGAGESRLQSLTLSENQLDDRAAILLANSPALAGLRHLDLEHNRIGHEGIRAILESRHLHESTELIVSHNPGDDDRLLAERFRQWMERMAGED